MRWLVFTFLFLSSVWSIGQNPPTEQNPKTKKYSAEGAAAIECVPKKKELESTLGCHAYKVAPDIFWGFWNPKPAKGVCVKVILGKPVEELSGLDCVGEPLELTVPNGQRVNLTTLYDNQFCKSTSTTVSITRASVDNPVPDIVALGAKIGLLGYEAPNVYTLDPQTNKIVSIDATCKVDADHKSTQNVKITYQNPPRVAVSAGFLLATTGIQSYGIKTSQTGIGSGGVVNAQTSIAVTGAPKAQFIPFSFVNLYVAGSRTLNLGPQMGIGVNPNLSTPRVEFFVSPISVGWHDAYFSLGFHIGQHERLTGGFSVGELTPSSLKAPIGWTYYTGLGFSVSYNLKPLVKGSSAAK